MDTSTIMVILFIFLLMLFSNNRTQNSNLLHILQYASEACFFNRDANKPKYFKVQFPPLPLSEVE